MSIYIGIFGDSHDAREALTAALALLQVHAPLAYLHLGDVCSPGMLELCAGLGAPFHFVFGNSDYDEEGLRKRAAALGLHCHGHFADLTIENKRLALVHGDNHTRMDQLLDTQLYDYLLHGHTHVRATSRLGKTRIINPGASTGRSPRRWRCWSCTPRGWNF